jgi:hypothetical protein
VEGLLADLREGVAVVEETNRLRGLELLLRAAGPAGTSAREVMAKVQEITSRPEVQAGPFLVWGLVPARG